MVHQHFMLVEPFTVAQNIILGSEKTGALGTIDSKGGPAGDFGTEREIRPLGGP